MKILVFILSLGISIYSFAADGHGPNTTVKYIYSSTTGGPPYVSFDVGAMPGCYADRGGYIPLTDNEAAQRTYSLLLAAYMSGKPVSVYYNYVNTDPSYNGWGKCHIEGVDLK